jgi:hypothetical protein
MRPLASDWASWLVLRHGWVAAPAAASSAFLASSASATLVAIDAGDGLREVWPEFPAWMAAHFAHAVRLDEARQRAAAFVANVRRVWAGDPQAGSEDYVRWMMNWNPFRRATDSGRFLAGLRKAGLIRWRGRSGGGRRRGLFTLGHDLALRRQHDADRRAVLHRPAVPVVVAALLEIGDLLEARGLHLPLGVVRRRAVDLVPWGASRRRRPGGEQRHQGRQCDSLQFSNHDRPRC